MTAVTTMIDIIRIVPGGFSLRSATKTPSLSIFSRKLGVLGLSENRGKGEEQAISLKAVEKPDGLEVVMCVTVFRYLFDYSKAWKNIIIVYLVLVKKK